MILDTNTLSATADGDETIRDQLAECASLEIPVIVLGEWMFGIRQSRHRKQYQEWLELNQSAFDVLVVDYKTASFYAEIREQLKVIGKPIPSNDAWIAALALQHDFPILSRDSHFDRLKGIRRVGW